MHNITYWFTGESYPLNEIVHFYSHFIAQRQLIDIYLQWFKIILYLCAQVNGFM